MRTKPGGQVVGKDWQATDFFHFLHFGSLSKIHGTVVECMLRMKFGVGYVRYRRSARLIKLCMHLIFVILYVVRANTDCNKERDMRVRNNIQITPNEPLPEELSISFIDYGQNLSSDNPD